MIRYIFVFLFIFLTAFAEEENIISKSDIVPSDVQKTLGIKAIKIKRESFNITRKYPAIVKDDLTLSEAICSPVDGIVKKLLVKEGDYVKKGQAVAYIYSPAIVNLIARIKQAKVRFKTSKELFLKEKELFEKKVIPYNRFFRAKIDYENAKSILNALIETLKIYGEVKNNLLVLRSGINGYIAKQNVIKGESVGIEKMLFKIHVHNKLWTVAYIPVEDTVFMKKGLKATILSPLGKTSGYVDFVSHFVDKDTKRVEVRILTDNKKEVLKPGMYVDVFFNVGKISGIFLPSSALALKDGEFYVFIKNGEHFKPIKVKTGKKIDGMYLISSGLKEGDEVVVEGTVHLKAKFFGEAEEE